MCELLTLCPPYSDIMKGGGKKDGGGEQPMSWDQVVALTHKEGVMLRPTIPDYIDAEAAELVRSCWAHDPAARPSFRVILVRLEGIARKEKTVADAKKDEAKEMRALFRSIHDLIWLYRSSDWDDKAALSLIAADISVTAADKTLREILSGDKEGLERIKSLGWLMFGGFEDGAEIIPEPLLDRDIVCDADKGSGLVAFHFAVKPPAKTIQWRTGDTKEFDALGVALAEMEKSLKKSEDDTEALEKAVVESKEDAKARRRRMMRRKKPPPRGGGGRPQKNKEVTRFMKAAKFVQGMGAGALLWREVGENDMALVEGDRIQLIGAGLTHTFSLVSFSHTCRQDPSQRQAHALWPPHAGVTRRRSHPRRW